MDRSTYSAKQLAREMGITPKQLRKFFRTKASSTPPIGRGHQYDFKACEVDAITLEYRYWRLNIERKNSERRRPD